MKKSLFWSMIVFMLVAIVGLSACSKDDDDNSNSSGSKTTWNWSNSSGKENLTIVFNSNGTGTWSFVEVSSSGKVYQNAGTLTWTETSSKKGMIVVIGTDEDFSASGNDESAVLYYKITDNKMYVYEKSNFSDLMFTLTKQ